MACYGASRSRRSRPLNPTDERCEHAALIAPMVVAERVFVQIALKMLGRDNVVNPTDAPLHQRPESFDGVGVHIPADVDFLGVVNPVVEVAGPAKGAVGLPFVSVDDGAGEDMLCYKRDEGAARRVGNLLGDDATLALNHPEHGGLAGARARATRAPVPSLSAHVSFVGFGLTAHLVTPLAPKGANLVRP